MYSVRLLTEEDYPMLVRWWTWFRFPSPPQAILPNNGTCGIMVSKDGVDICAGFLYLTNSALGWVEYIVSNPEVREGREEAIRHLIDQLSAYAKKKGCLALFTSIKHPNLIKHYEACGYAKGSNNTFEMSIVL